jgi:cellulose synthase/poly-beta-1,6-N-acetylglucosamine synthase-like glycosyltransferase
MTLVIILITIVYLILIGSFIIGFDKIKSLNLDDLEVNTRFTIIIPFKNEDQNLPELLISLTELNYAEKLYEVIFVNDESTDESEAIINNFLSNNSNNYKLINNERRSKSPKKDAINKAISIARNNWIITTDADCVVPKYWLDCFDSFIQKTNSCFIAAPVSYHKGISFLERFQSLDLLSLIGATIGGFGIGKPFLCNGANLGYKKSLFKELNGFEGNTNIASGDDIFLLEKAVKKYPTQVHYLKSELAIVKTKPQHSFKDLLSQRIRWAAKTSSYNNLFGKITGLLVLLMNSTIICGLIFVLIGLVNYKILLYILVIKVSIDFLLIYKTARFMNQEEVVSSYLFSCIIHPFFIVYVAIVSVFKGYKWKGNYYKK